MADILASVSVVLGAEISGFRAAMAQANRDLKGLRQAGEAMKNVGSSLTQYVSAPLAAFGVLAVAASAKLDGLQRGLNAITTAELAKNGAAGLNSIQAAAAATGERLKELEGIAKAPGIGFEQAVQGDIRLRAVGISAGQSAKALKEFANAIATTGGGASEFDRVTTQLSQLSAKGKVLSQDLRPIIEAAPAVSQALLQLYGTIDSETISASLAKQGKSSQDFIAVLTDELAKLPRVTGGLANSFENLAQTTTQSLAKFGDGISKALNLPAVTERLSNGIEALGNSFAGLSPGTQGLIVGLAGIAAAVGPVLVAVGTLGAALPAITAGFSVLGISSLAALGPILPVAAGVAAAAYLIYENWSDLTAYFTSGEGATLFSDLAASASSAASAIGEAFRTMRASAGSNLGDMVSAATIFRTTFREVAVGVTSVLNVFSGTISGLTSLLTGDFSQAAAGARQAFFGLIDPIANLLGFTVRAQEANPILALSKSATEFNAVFPQLRANLALLNSAAADAFGGTADGVDFFGAGINTVTGKIAKLEERIKTLKEAKPTLQFDQDIAAANLLIASLEEQLKKLNALGVGSDAAQKALAKLREDLSLNVKFSLALGESYDYIKERAATLTQGIKSLTEVGFSPLGKTVQGLVSDLSKLYPQLELKKVKVAPLKIEAPKLLSLDFSNTPVDAEGIGAAYDTMTAKLNEKREPFRAGLLAFNTDSEEALNQLKDGLINSISGIGQAIGGALFDGTSIGQALTASFAPIIEALAIFAEKKGKLYIGLGIADLAIPGLQAQGLAEIAGGTALLLAAGVARAGASSLSTGSRAGGGGSGRISTSPASTTRTFNPTVAPAAASAPATYKHTVVITADGRALSGVLQLELDRNGRVLGSR